MDNLIENLPDIHYLNNYKANEGNYGFYETNIIFCCHKIMDIYWAYCIARANLVYFTNKDFGDFARDDNSKLFLKYQLIQNALTYYNIIIDLSWQFLWFFYQPEIENKLPTTKLYDAIAKECTLEELKCRLTIARDTKIRDYYVDKLFNNELVQELRENYNFIKHRGTFYSPGLGLNDHRMLVRFNNLNLPLVQRREINLEEMFRKLIKFDKLYHDYISNIIKIYMPSDYLIHNDGLSSIANYYLKHEEQIIEWNKRYNFKRK